MLVKKVKLNNFRNYQNDEFEFLPHLNILLGPNGKGKTNILESLIFISNTKSFRTLNDKDLIKKDEDYLRIICQSDTNEYKAVVNKDGKHLYINNIPIKKTSEFIGELNCILFKPSDVELFNQSPKERRRIFDIEIGKVSKEYLNAILEYNLLLKDKNRLLKENNIDEIYLNLINERMIPNIIKIIKGRKEFIEVINYYINGYYLKISGENRNIKVIYKKCCEIDDVENSLKKNQEKDIYYHYASFGPHHDDFEFMMDDYELTSIASQGQKRMTLIAFKLAILKYVFHLTKQMPILLLDDILSELDVKNRERLLDVINEDFQVIITSTDLLGIDVKREYNLIRV